MTALDWRHPAVLGEALARMARVMERWVTEHAATEVPLPWLVPERYVDATRPSWAPPQPATVHGSWVASGEQSFLQLAEEGRLPLSLRFIGWTPCVREETFGPHHHYTFIKAEVFEWVDPQRDEASQLEALVGAARDALAPETPGLLREVPLTDGTWDLELNGLEVGSYGVRVSPLSGRRYLYATALAEPRFSEALAMDAPT